jgi:hypothetical protein
MNNEDFIHNLIKEEKEFFINLISKYYYFNLQNLQKVKEKVNWKFISNNQNILWSLEFVKEYEDKLYFDLLDWTNHEDSERPGLSSNPKISIEIIEKYKNELNWEMLSSNFNFSNLDIDEVLERESFLWNWNDLYYNLTLPSWNETFIEKHKNKLDWKVWKKLSRYFNFSNLDYNRILENNFFLWDWYYLSNNDTLPWNENFIERYKSKLNWKELCSNSKVNWTESFIKKHNNKLDWINLSFNSRLPWSKSFLIKYEKQININNLSRNEGFSWSEELIEEYKDTINWDYLSKNTGVQWSSNLIERFGYKNIDIFDLTEPQVFYSYQLSQNKSLPWQDITFFMKFILFYISDCDYTGLINNQGIIWDEVKIEICKMKWKDFSLEKNNHKKTLTNLPFYMKDKEENEDIIWELINPFVEDNNLEEILK